MKKRNIIRKVGCTTTVLAASAWTGLWQYRHSGGELWTAVIAGGCVLIALSFVAVGMFEKIGGGIMSDKTFIVVYDDEQSLCIPYAWDEDCKGALVAICGKQNAACFNSRKAARKAINISTAFARLKKTQGESVCDDFISEKHYVMVIECRSREAK